MTPVAYHPLAASELIESAKFYESRRELLGHGFLDSVEQSVMALRSRPKSGLAGKLGTRSWKVHRFPFRIVYLEMPGRIWIVAVAHLSRKPGYWLERI